LLAPGYWRLAFRFQLGQFELDDGYGIFNRLELLADALMVSWLLIALSVPSKRP
jgi:hypothetical protein